MADSKATSGQSATGPPILRALFETLVAAALVGAGGSYLLDGTIRHEPWVGFGLIALGVLVFLMRGRVVTGFEAGPGGVKFVLDRALAEAREAKGEAHAAKEDAEAAKQIASQQIIPAGKNANAASALALDVRPAMIGGANGDWTHPDLRRRDPPDDDPQKGQWGGEDERNGRRLEATVKAIGDELFEIVLTVSPAQATDEPVVGDVRFHLHDSFQRSIRTVKAREGRARLSLVAWGAFTVGAEVRGEPETYLELDLADPKYRYPETFRKR